EGASNLFAGYRSMAVVVQNGPLDALPTGPPLPAELGARLAALPGAGAVRAESAGLVTLSGRRVLVYGVDVGSLLPHFLLAPAAARAAVFTGPEVIASRVFAAALGLKP